MSIEYWANHSEKPSGTERPLKGAVSLFEMNLESMGFDIERLRFYRWLIERGRDQAWRGRAKFRRPWLVHKLDLRPAPEHSGPSSPEAQPLEHAEAKQ